jgi:hypothetical protein
MLRILILTITTVFFLENLAAVSAQEPAPSAEVPAPSGEPALRPFIPKTDSPLQCVDFYREDSVVVHMRTELSQTVPGATLLFTGTVVNRNTYPITKGILIAKVYRNVGETDREVVDQFIVKDDITLVAQSEQDISHEWTVPMNESAGTYSIAYYLNTGSFTVVGESRLNHSPSISNPFTVTSDFQVVTFESGSTRVNDLPYNVSTALPYEIRGGEEVTIKTVITNPTNEQKTLPLQWNQYSRNDVDPSNRRNTKTEVLVLNPRESKEVSYTLTRESDPVLYVTASVLDNEARHSIDVVLVRPQLDSVQIDFSGLTGYPLQSNTQQTLFTCLKGENLYAINDITVRLLLITSDGTKIHEYQYKGAVRSELGGFGEQFTLPENYNDFSLVTILEREGRIIGMATTTYSCVDLGSTPCGAREEALGAQWFDFIKNSQFLFVGGGVLMLLLGWILFRALRNKRAKREDDPIINGVKMHLPE